MGFSPIGAVILVEFPYADLKTLKKRPAVIIAHSSLDTVIICQITSKKLPGAPVINITYKDFLSGSLPVDSFARPDKLFTIDSNLASNLLGILSKDKSAQIKTAIKELFD